MAMIDPATGWFEIVKVPTCDLDKVMGSNDEYIDKSYSRVIQLLNNTWIIRYPHPLKAVIDNISEFKQYFNTFLNDFDIKPVLTTIKKPQDNAPVERVHQLILNMILTKDLASKVLGYIYPWGETLAYTAWTVRASYHHTIQATPGQDVFDREMILNPTSVVDWRGITAAKKRQVDIDNVQEKNR